MTSPLTDEERKAVEAARKWKHENAWNKNERPIRWELVGARDEHDDGEYLFSDVRAGFACGHLSGRRAGRIEALREACGVMCWACRRGSPTQDDAASVVIHMIGSGEVPCEAGPLRAKLAEAQKETT